MSLISFSTPTLKNALKRVMHSHNVRAMTVLSKESGEEYKKMVCFALNCDRSVIPYFITEQQVAQKLFRTTPVV
jgi:hypothetical protein